MRAGAPSLAHRTGGLLFAYVLLASVACASADTLDVPGTYASVQAAIDAAKPGDVVRLAPGVHTGRPTLGGKAITLASHYLDTGDRAYVDQTVLDGTGGSWALRILPGPGAPTIVGLTIRGAEDGITATGRFRLLDCRVTATGDGIDYEDGSGGLVSGCTFEGNTDDGIDSDYAVNAVIVGNTIRNNGDDGIEIRLQPYTGPRLSLVIRDNSISGNGEDGIQIISYNVETPRSIYIEGNRIVGNTMAGVGMMCCENTTENYQGAALKEYVGLFHNTIVGNHHGVTGGDSLVLVNNLIVGSTGVGLTRASGGSIAAHNLFYGNGVDHVGSNVDEGSTLYQNPILRPDLGLAYDSPAIDAGCTDFTANGRTVWPRSLLRFSGAAPDLGAVESPATLDVGDGDKGPGMELLQPTPNPARGPSLLRFVLPAAGRVRLEVLDVAGRKVRLLRDGVASAGRHEVAWDGLDDAGGTVSAGTYFARLTSGDRTRTRRFTRL